MVLGYYVSIKILELDEFRVLLTSFMLFYAMMSAGSSFMNIPSVQKAKAAAVDVFSIIDEKSNLDVRDETKGENIKELGPGRIQFK